VLQAWFYAQKFGERVMGRGQKIGIFHSSRDRLAMCYGRQIGHAMSTRQAIGAHTGTGGQCADATETGIGADGSKRMLHMGMGSGALGWQKAEWAYLQCPTYAA